MSPSIPPPISSSRLQSLAAVALTAWAGIALLFKPGTAADQPSLRHARRIADEARQDAPHPHARGVTRQQAVRRSKAEGRGADSPAGIPPTGWLQVGKRVFANISTDRVLAEAAGVTFYALLALFPAITSMISIYGLIADPAAIEGDVAQLNGIVPAGGIQIIHDQVHSLAASGHQALGLGAVIGLLVSIWSANSGAKAVFDALNAVYEEREQRSFVRLTLISLAFTLGGLLFVILALAGVVAVPAVIAYVGLGATGDLLLRVLRWPLLLVVLMGVLALLYRFGPSRAKARWQWISWGSAFAAITWLLVSAAFSYYVAHFGNYNKTYGSLGAAVGFMTWIWVSTIVVLIGAELNAELEHQTEHDSTIGPARPLGSRGATKADRVAAP